jgi:hypothetical protein
MYIKKKEKNKKTNEFLILINAFDYKRNKIITI